MAFNRKQQTASMRPGLISFTGDVAGAVGSPLSPVLVDPNLFIFRNEGIEDTSTPVFFGGDVPAAGKEPAPKTEDNASVANDKASSFSLPDFFLGDSTDTQADKAAIGITGLILIGIGVIIWKRLR